VNYRLWPETWALLQRFRQPSGELVLRTNTGRAWVRDEIDAAGERHKTDQIRTDYGRFTIKQGSSLSLSSLRKVGATLLADERAHAVFAQRFLGQAPTTIAEKHYIGEGAGQASFDEAVAFVRTKIWSLPDEQTAIIPLPDLPELG
jgi:hypothetical protein